MVCILWILTYHPFALKGFTDYNLMIVESVAKILDYFNKEKIVRIILMMFDVSTDPKSHDSCRTSSPTPSAWSISQ